MISESILQCQFILYTGYLMEQESRPDFRQRCELIRKPIDNWDDFKSTWKQVYFNESLNYLDQQALTSFWEQQLSLLSKQTQKISILVPLMVNKLPQPTPQQQDTRPADHKEEQASVANNVKETPEKKQSKQDKQPGKNNKKAGVPKKEASNQVKLDKKVIETAMNLIGQKFKKIEYVYESLFIGNEKQLLIYKSCSAMNRYLSKYRLPNNFKPKLDEFSKLADQFYEAKRKANLAISTFSARSRDRLLKELNSLRQLVNKQLQDFRDYFKSILLDFAANPKTTIILLQAVRDEMLGMLQDLAQQCQLELKCKYFQTDYDQIKDLQITKPTHDDLEEPCQQQKEVPATKYVYVEPPKLPQSPKDLYNVKLIGANLKNQSWVWRFFMPKCGDHNKIKGIYLRAPEGEGPSELNRQINTDAEQIDVELYPYKLGKTVWQIYLWNDVGFTKSTEKIIIYNQLEIKEKSPPLQNYQATLVGISEFGIILQQEDFKTVSHCKQISIYNAAVICDAQGTAGGWGQMYYPLSPEKQENTSEVEISMNLFKNQRIESPFLVLKNQFIRKVSCGMGYTLMLSSQGVIWSFGFNGYGQLGQGHLQSNQYTTEPKQICKFTRDNGTFVTDICSSTKGSSFALDDDGRVYRWGYNQIDQTYYPVHDRFGTVVNYQTKYIVYKNSTPISISRGVISGQAKTIQACNEHYFVLNKEGDLYGWGMVRMLGLGVLKDTNEEEVVDIVIPTHVMSQVEDVSTSFHHTIVTTKKGKIFGWGKANLFSNKLSGYYDRPVDITDEYLGEAKKSIKSIKAGVNYTVVLRQDNSIELMGTQTLLKIDSSAFSKNICKIACSKLEECFAVLTEQ